MALSPTSAHGGTTQALVSCVLARDSGLNIRSVQRAITWDGLYNNASAFTPLSSIPTGLGLSFLFDGTAAGITTTEAGTWAFSYQLVRSADATWQGSLDDTTGPGRNFQLGTLVTSGGAGDVLTDVLHLPSGVTITPTVNVVVAATANPYEANAYLSIVRFG